MKYIKHFAIGVITFGVLCAGFNLLIDPLGIFNVPDIKGINTVKIPGSPRFFKPLQASARQPNTVFIGSSRAEVGLDPMDLPGSYNLGIPGLLAAELNGYGKHLLADTDVKHIIIGLDFLSFNDRLVSQTGFKSAVLGKYALIRSLPETLFSSNTLDLSRKTFRRSLKGDDVRHTKDGLYHLKLPAGYTSEKALMESVVSFLKTSGSYGQFESYSRSLAELKSFIETAQLKNIKVDLFISPTHAALMEALDLSGLWPKYEMWKRELVSIADKHKLKLWNFGGYTKLSTVAINDAQASFIDASHYRPVVGKQIIQTLLGAAKTPDFATFLSAENIEVHIMQQRHAKDEYRKKMIEDVELTRATACKLSNFRDKVKCQKK